MADKDRIPLEELHTAAHPTFFITPTLSNLVLPERRKPSGSVKEHRRSESFHSSSTITSFASLSNAHIFHETKEGSVCGENEKVSDKRSRYNDTAPADVDDGDEDGYDTDIEIPDRKPTSLDIYGCKVYKKACSRLNMDIISQLEKQLRTSNLVVRSHGLKSRDMLAICNALLENTSVTDLILDNNEICCKGVTYLSWLLTENRTIRHLSLADNFIGNEGMQVLVKSLVTHPRIIKCNLAGNKMGDRIAGDLAGIFQWNKTLTDLTISHNNLGDKAAQILGEALGDNDYLKQLDISWNKIRPNGIMYFCQGLMRNESLKYLNLAMNGVSLVGATALCALLINNRTLETLDLTNTRIIDEPAGVIGKALIENETLKTLKISQNPITAHGAAAILESIKKNEGCGLKLLDLSTTHVLQDFIDDVDELAQRKVVIEVKIGGVVSTYQPLESQDIEWLQYKNPLTLLRWYIKSTGMRLIDFFILFDKDGSLSVSREEFIEGLNDIDLPLSEAQIDHLINILDKDGDGEVDFGELMAGDKTQRRKEWSKKQTKHDKVSAAQYEQSIPRRSSLVPDNNLSQRRGSRESAGSPRGRRGSKTSEDRNSLMTSPAPGTRQSLNTLQVPEPDYGRRQSLKSPSQST